MVTIFNYILLKLLISYGVYVVAKSKNIKWLVNLASLLISVLIFMLILAFAIVAFPLNLGPIQNLSSDTIDSAFPSVMNDGKNLYLVWSSGDFYTPCSDCHILYRRSLDGGVNWNPSLDLLPSNLSVGIPNSYNPKIAVSGNLVVVVWISYNRTNGENAFNGDLFLRRSLDGGKTFEPVQKLRSGPVLEPQVVISGSNIHVLWVERNTYWPFPTNVLYTNSVDQGLNFGIPITLSEGDPYYSHEQAQISASGQYVGVIWINGSSNSRPLMFKGSNDSGSSFTSAKAISESRPDIGVASPQISLVGENVHVAWLQSTEGSNYYVVYRKSINGGTSLGPLQNLSNNESIALKIITDKNLIYVIWTDYNGNGLQFRKSLNNGDTFESSIYLAGTTISANAPSITAQNQAVGVAWWARNGGIDQSDIQFRYSIDGGTNWNPSLDNTGEYISFNPGLSQSPQVLTDGLNFYVFWQDRENGHYDILFRRTESTAFALGFPLKGLSPGLDQHLTPENASINSVFDHSMKDRRGDYRLYGTTGTDNVVVAYTSEIGAKIKGSDDYKNSGCYKQANNQSFIVNGHYTAARFPTNYLCYDGHPGIDFRAAKGTEVYASVSGTINYPQNIIGLRAPKGKAYKKHHVLEIIPDGFPEYKIYYLHLYTHPAAKLNVTKNVTIPGCPSSVTLPLQNGTHVSKGCLIALVGDAGSPKQPHLHFEVQKVAPPSEIKESARDYLKCIDIPNMDCVPVDPYGWESSSPDPYFNLTNVTHVRLWE